jgi:hypothetical protein
MGCVVAVLALLLTAVLLVLSMLLQELRPPPSVAGYGAVQSLMPLPSNPRMSASVRLLTEYLHRLHGQPYAFDNMV